MTDIHTFVQDYIAVWNEPDAGKRRQLICTLWQEDANHLARTLEAVGHAGIEKRVTGAYDKWVKEKGNVFRLQGSVDGHHDNGQAALGDAAGGRWRGDLGRLRLPGAGR